MMLDCPHCLRTVIPLPGGQCPVCRGNTKEPGKHTAEREVLEVGEKSALPEVCCHCAALTRRTVKITGTAPAANDNLSPASRYEEEGTSAARLLIGLAGGPLVMLLALLARGITGGLSDGGRAAIRVIVRMRQCADCARQGRVEAIHVDFDYYRMRFAVHRRFAEHFRQLNPRR